MIMSGNCFVFFFGDTEWGKARKGVMFVTGNPDGGSAFASWF